MYFIPLIVIFLIALAIFLSPILALIIVVLFLLGLGAYKFLGHGTDPEQAPPPQESRPAANGSGTATAAGHSSEEDTGMWGETWPEQRQSKGPS
jgi:hypothetical protein